MKNVVAFVLALMAASAWAAQEPAAPDIPAFVKRLDSLRESHRIQGLSAVVVRDQAIVLAVGLGYADVEGRIPATAETAYDIASVAKPLSAVVALRLVDEGKLDIDRPMSAYSQWPDFCAGFSQQPTIFAKDLRCEPPVHTLRHLLSHTATGTPGEHFSYNPVLFSWASRPVMAVAGAPFSDLVKRYVFEPAGMTRSARKHRDLPLREVVAKQLAPAYHVNAAGAVGRSPASPPQGDGAAGGVVTTAIDLAKFDIALDQGTLISAKSRKAMMTPMRSSDGKQLPYGVGWFVQEYQGHTLAWHSGWWENAYSALYVKVPDRNLSFIVLANGEGVWRGNPQDKADVETSEFAKAFLQAFVGR